MLEQERAASRAVRRNPWLLVCGGVVALAWLVVNVAAIVRVMFLVLPKQTQPVFVLPMASVLTVLVLPPTLSGLYSAVRETGARDEPPGPIGTLRLYGLGCLRHARDLTTATVVFRVAALVPVLAVFALLLAGDTALNYWQYTTPTGDVPGPLKGSVELLVVLTYGMIAGAVGRLALAFYDMTVLFAGVPAKRGWRAALRVTLRRPRAILRYGAGRFLLWSPMLVVVIQEISIVSSGNISRGNALAGLGMFVASAMALGTVVTTLLAAHHVEVYEQTIEPVLAEPTPLSKGSSAPSEWAAGPSPDREVEGQSTLQSTAAVAFTVLLVVVLAAGTTAVRVEDVRPMQASERPVGDSMNAGAIASNAGRLLANASYRSHKRTYRFNLSTGERKLQVETNTSVDRLDREIRVSTGLHRNGNWTRAGYYGSETTLAIDFLGESDESRRVVLAELFLGRLAGEWRIMYFPGYPWMAELTHGHVIDTDDRDVQLVERTDSRVVVGYSRRPEVDGADGDDVVERVRLTVDPETGRPTRFVHNKTIVERENGSIVGRYRVLTVRTYSAYGTAEVRRPAPAGSPGPLEWLWDSVYY